VHDRFRNELIEGALLATPSSCKQLQAGGVASNPPPFSSE
jgi:hypothetical protein